MNPTFIIVGAAALVGIVGVSIYSMSSPVISEESRQALSNADAKARSVLKEPVPDKWLTNKPIVGGKKTKKTYSKKTKPRKNTKRK